VCDWHWVNMYLLNASATSNTAITYAVLQQDILASP
jgi:hypothetical protein